MCGAATLSPVLEPDISSYVWSMVSLLPLAWLAALDLYGLDLNRDLPDYRPTERGNRPQPQLRADYGRSGAGCGAVRRRFFFART